MASQDLNGNNISSLLFPKEIRRHLHAISPDLTPQSLLAARKNLRWTRDQLIEDVLANDYGVEFEMRTIQSTKIDLHASLHNGARLERHDGVTIDLRRISVMARSFIKAPISMHPFIAWNDPATKLFKNLDGNHRHTLTRAMAIDDVMIYDVKCDEETANLIATSINLFTGQGMTPSQAMMQAIAKLNEIVLKTGAPPTKEDFTKVAAVFKQSRQKLKTRYENSVFLQYLTSSRADGGLGVSDPKGRLNDSILTEIKKLPNDDPLIDYQLEAAQAVVMFDLTASQVSNLVRACKTKTSFMQALACEATISTPLTGGFPNSTARNLFQFLNGLVAMLENWVEEEKTFAEMLPNVKQQVAATNQLNKIPHLMKALGVTICRSKPIRI